MKKLLLTSTGLTNPKIAHTFFSLILETSEKIKIAFFPTAATTSEELKYVNESRDELIRLGIMCENIKEINLDHKINYNERKNLLGCKRWKYCCNPKHSSSLY